MEKAIFSITCTTCQARLAVRSKAAMGAILECPKCQSMVHVAPPAWWKPTPPQDCQSPASTLAGPPPLDRVAAGPLTLDLELTEMSWLDAVFRHLWLVWSAALVTALIVVWGLWWFWVPRPAPQSVAFEIERTATEAKRPATAVAGTAGAAVDKPSNTLEPRQSGGVKPAPTPTHLASPLVTQSPPTADAKPAEPDPFAEIADEAAEGAAQAARTVEISKAPPAHVDVAARMADPLPEIELTDVPLAKAVNLLAAIGAMPITLDADAMAQLGAAPRDPISLRLGSTTIGEVLQAVVAQRGLAVVVDNGQVIVTAPAEHRETLRKVRYTVSDLTGDDEAAVAELAALVQRLAAPESWRKNGGPGTIEPDHDALVVVQTGDVHQRVLVFCEKLRKARRKPLRSREDPERFTLVTRRQQARKMLDQPTSVNFHEPAPLAKILTFLAEATDSDILIDHAALAAADTSDRVETALTARKRRFGAALTDLLRPLGLTYRVVGADAIQVTTKEAVEDRLELEFYPVGPWLSKGISGSKLAERLKARVAASTWSDVGGPGEVCFDSPSRCLIVLQSQPVQAAVERLLAGGARGEGRGTGGEP